MNRFSVLMMGLAVLVGIVVWMSFEVPTDEAVSPVVLNTEGKYTNVVNWPPQTQLVDEAYSCTSTGVEVDRESETEERLVNGKEYCITTILEGAAGSTYTQYSYATEANGKTLVFTFSARASQCGNYVTEEKLVCEAEQKAFNPDPFIDELARKQNDVGTKNLGEVSSREATLSGTYVCLPHTDTTGPQTLECALGLHASDGSYYALDFNQSPNAQFVLQTGDRFRASGILTPVEMLSTDMWRKYPIKGIFTITGSVEKI